MASPGFSGVDGTFITVPSIVTTSVNVPPVSTPILIDRKAGGREPGGRCGCDRSAGTGSNLLFGCEVQVPDLCAKAGEPS